MYRLLCVLISLLILAAARGQMRTDDELREAAATFFADHTGQQNGMSASKTYRAENITLALQKENLAVATDGDRFVVLARNKEMMSVLGFSESSYSEPDMPLALTAWIETTNTLLSEEAPSHMFEQKSLKMPESVPDHVEPLIKTIWSQWDPYNAMVPHYIKSSDDDYTYPSDKGTYAEIPTGCIATSMSQLMNYYRYPAHGRGSHSLSVKQGNGTEEVLTMDFGKVTFDWSSMLDIYDYSYSFNPENNTFTLKPDFTQKQADAVATLTLACGIASDMNYTPKGSAAAMTIAASAFTQYF
ncbi:MAG: C10 family peptidase, partial [Bacteroidaceae bacterium]|nr:C10 family peptidase [Bacteroidaceae bacterium]